MSHNERKVYTGGIRKKRGVPLDDKKKETEKNRENFRKGVNYGKRRISS